LRADQRDTGPFEVEPAFEDCSRDGGFAEALALLGEELEGAEKYGGIAVVSQGSGACYANRAARDPAGRSRSVVDEARGH